MSRAGRIALTLLAVLGACINVTCIGYWLSQGIIHLLRWFWSR